MKTNLFLLISLFLVGIFTQLSAKPLKYHEKKAGGGPDGYNSVVRNVDDNIFRTKISQECTGPGTEACPFSVSGDPTTYPDIYDVNTMYGFIMNAVSLGTFNGTHTINNVLGEWSGSDPFNIEIEISSLDFVE